MGQIAISPANLPATLADGIVALAERDAHCVAEYLAQRFANPELWLGPDTCSATWQSICPPAFLLELSAALRICAWEQLNLVRPEMSLPEGAVAIQTILSQLGEDEFEPCLSLLVFRTFVSHFAWQGIAMLGIDVLLDKLDETQLADRIAEHLWKNRHAYRGGSNG